MGFWPTLREQLCGTGFGLGQKATRGAFGHAVRTTLGGNSDYASHVLFNRT
ncbi:MULTISPECIES: hypothetical protein [unclassified Moorena]|uniref:hypothetical protein n=1 Tax=unclassified Moorena TaxID=2683338 RepID=UPI00140184F3|nr:MULTISPECIES: hypothetical protein [unclassified Moorena]NEO16029.1 hypothetical protein [Moorena sp. SIO3E8]NEQ02153.1 hypothetical protein [Moorena sp. SIO3F7]